MLKHLKNMIGTCQGLCKGSISYLLAALGTDTLMQIWLVKECGKTWSLCPTCEHKGTVRYQDVGFNCCAYSDLKSNLEKQFIC